MDNTVSFMRDSILDIQSTIRALDTKVAALLVVLLAPLSNLGKIINHVDNYLIKYPDNWHLVVVMFFAVSWALALIASIRVISAIDNPAGHIINADEYSGVYYSGGLFNPSIIDVFFNSSTLKASRDVESHLAIFPNDETSVKQELAFEQLKLVYIRDIKLVRFKFSLHAIYVWMTLGLFIYLLSRFI